MVRIKLHPDHPSGPKKIGEYTYWKDCWRYHANIPAVINRSEVIIEKQSKKKGDICDCGAVLTSIAETRAEWVRCAECQRIDEDDWYIPYECVIRWQSG